MKRYIRLEEENIFKISKKDFLLNPIDGYKYIDDNYVARRDRQNKITYITDKFFKLKGDKFGRQSLLYHELGHDLIQVPTDFNKYFKDVLEPFRVDKDKKISAQSRYEDYFGLPTITVPEEVIANGYKAMMIDEYKGYEEGGNVHKFMISIFNRAKQLKMETKKIVM